MPKRKIYKGYYHIYNRGLLKMIIFRSTDDYLRMYKILNKYTKKDRYFGLKIMAYNFLPNHFHFVIFNPGVEVSNFFGDIQNSYAKYYNIKYSRKGQLFEGRFKAKIISDYGYLEKSIIYVENNALKHSIVDNSYKWGYSSLVNPGVKL